jgi:NADH dehydrogenase
MEVWLGPPLGFDVMAGRVRVFGSGDQKPSWISLGDVAAFVVACVDHPGARNKRIELGGPDALSPGEVIRMVEDIGGKPVQVEYVPVEALEDQRRAATNEFDESLSALMLGQTNGDVIDMSGTLAEFPVRLSPVGEHAKGVLQA